MTALDPPASAERALRCDWVLACQTALVDRLTNKISLIHVLENVAVPGFPTVLPGFHVVAFWQHRSDVVLHADLMLELVEVGGGGASSKLAEERIEFVGRSGHRSICIVHSLTVLRPGRYAIAARWRRAGQDTWHPAAEHWLAIQTAQGAAAEA